MGQNPLPIFGRPEKSEFSSRERPEKERYSYWREVICRTLSPVETERHKSTDHFEFELKRLSFGETSVCDLTFSPMINIRSSQCIRRMPDEDVFVALIGSGKPSMSQDGRVAEPLAGDVVLYDSARPFQWRFDDETRLTVMRLPSRQALARLGDPKHLTARTIAGSSPLGGILRHSITDLARLDLSFDDLRGKRIANSFIDIICSSVEAALTSADDTAVSNSLVKAAKEFIRKHIDNPDIELRHVAKSLNVSTRTLCRAFAAEQTTPMRWMWQKRVEHAYRLLNCGLVESVSAAAMQSGFNDFSHFSRVFKQAYGVLPRNVLNKSAASAVAVHYSS